MGLALANDVALSGQGRGPHATDHAHWSRPLMNTAPVRVVIIHSLRLRSIGLVLVSELEINLYVICDILHGC